MDNVAFVRKDEFIIKKECPLYDDDIFLRRNHRRYRGLI